MQHRNALSICLFACLLVLSGCAGSTNPTTPGTPAPPQSSSLTVLNTDQLILPTLPIANDAVKLLRDSGKITEAETVIVQNALLAVGSTIATCDRIALQAGGANLTSAQKAAIIQAWASAGLGQVIPKLSPDTVAKVQGIRSNINTILALVGGPTI